MSRSNLAAVVLNYGMPELALEAIQSLRASSRRVDELIVVDNGSTPGSRDVLSKALQSREQLVVSDGNRGFSGGCNLGILAALEAGADRVFLANSDLRLSPDALGRLENALDQWPRAGVAGPALLGDGKDRVESLGIRYSPRTGRMIHRGHGETLPVGPQRRTRPVDGVSGCAMLLTAELLNATGLLLEDYFFSFEDLDLCLRARAKGFEVLCVESALAFHQGSATIGPGSSLRIYYAMRNHLLLANRFGGDSKLPMSFARAAAIVGLTAGFALAKGRSARVAALSDLVRGLRDHLLDRYGSA